MKKIYTISALIILTALLAGCAPNNRAGASTPTVVAVAETISTPTRTPLPPTVTAIPAAAATATTTPLPPLPTRPTIVLPTPEPAGAPPVSVEALHGATLPNPVAKILAYELNVRTGPGPVYPAIDALKQDEIVEITGINYTGEWYRVARDGQVMGWISAAGKYVVTVPPQVDVPPVAAPPVPAGGGTLIIQPETGGDFYRLNADGSGLQRLSAGVDPALSPDGAKIAFTRYGPGEVGAVWIYDLSTGAEYPLIGEMFEPKSPAWSPDGRSLVISFQRGGRREIESRCYKMRADGTFRKPPPGAYDFKFVNGKLCFKLPPDTHWQLRRVDVAGGAFEDLASETYSYAPTWDPANPWRVIFAGSIGLQQLDLNRNEYFPFTADRFDRAPVMSPAGNAVAVSYRQDTHWEVYTINTAAGRRRRLTPSQPLLGKPFNSAAPAWSPNGKQIAFVTDRRGPWEFWVMNADGADPHPLLPADVAAQLNVQYHGVDERLISWGK